MIRASSRDRDPVCASRWRSSDLLLFLIACVIISWRRAPFLGQWDSFDYLKQIVTHQFSPLGFGRPAFLGYNLVLWEPFKRLFHPDPRAAESVVTAGVIIMGGLGVLAFAGLARRLLSETAARMAVLALVLSPTYIAYAGSVMTEIPMFAAAAASKGFGTIYVPFGVDGTPEPVVPIKTFKYDAIGEKIGKDVGKKYETTGAKVSKKYARAGDQFKKFGTPLPAAPSIPEPEVQEAAVDRVAVRAARIVPPSPRVCQGCNTHLSYATSGRCPVCGAKLS